MGYSAGLKAFTAAVLGGIGNIRGACWRAVSASPRASPSPSSTRRSRRRRFRPAVLVLVSGRGSLRREPADWKKCERWRLAGLRRDRLVALGGGSAALRAERLRHGVMTRICLYALLALGLNIVVGFAGCSTSATWRSSASAPITYAFLASPHFGAASAFVPSCRSSSR